MIILIHGDNIEESRNELIRLRHEAKNKEVRYLEGTKLDITSLTQAIESSSLFGGDVLIIIENLLSYAGKKSKAHETILNILKSSQNITVVLWEDKEIGKTVIEKLGPIVHPKLFKTPTVIFQFLDAVRPGNAKGMLALFHDCVAKEAPEVVFTLLVRRTRQLIMLKDNVSPVGLASWQLVRLTSQAKLFTIGKLLAMYRELAQIEYRVKTGASPFSLLLLLEQFFIDI